MTHVVLWYQQECSVIIVCSYIDTNTCNLHKHTHMHATMPPCSHTHTHTHTHAHTHSRTHTHTHTHIYTHTHTHTRTHACTHIHKHTHKHTLTPCETAKDVTVSSSYKHYLIIKENMITVSHFFQMPCYSTSFTIHYLHTWST